MRNRGQKRCPCPVAPQGSVQHHYQTRDENMGAKFIVHRPKVQVTPRACNWGLKWGAVLQDEPLTNGNRCHIQVDSIRMELNL